MYCAKCGTKNEARANFCENCGSKMEKAVKQNIKKEKNTTGQNNIIEKAKNMSKKAKMISAIIGVVIIILVAGGIVINSLTNPKKVAEKYFMAAIERDVDKLYSFVDVEKSSFTTEEMFKKINKVDTETTNIPKITNYKIGEPLNAADGLSTTITITYVLEGNSNSQTMDIKLIKSKEKTLGLFDKWKINTSITKATKGYEINVMKDSELTVEGVKVDKKYINKEKSTSKIDTYIMPAMFTNAYNITIKLPIGIKLEDEILVKENSSYKYSLSLKNLSDSEKDNLESKIKTDLQNIYNGAKDKKSFDEIKSAFEHEGVDLKDLKDAYEDLVSSISSDITLTSIEFTEIELDSISINSRGYLYIDAEASYDYELTYTSGEETKTNDSDGKDSTTYLTYDYIDGEFRLIDVSSLNSYYSKYY